MESAEKSGGRKSINRPIIATLILGFAAFFLLAGYECARSASVSLYLETYGAHLLPVVLVLGPFGTLVMLYGYGWLLSRFGAKRTLLFTSLFSGLGILVCYLAIISGNRLAVGGIYVFREAYIVLLIEQYWSFINSTLKSDQAKRFNGLICGIASIGAILGGLFVGRAGNWLSTEHLLLFAAFSLLPAALLSLLAYKLGGEPMPSSLEQQKGQEVLALNLFRRNRNILYIAMLVTLTQVIATVLELRFNGILETEIPVMDTRTAYLGNFYALLNSVAFTFQFIFTPILLRYFSLRHVHFAIPLLHLTTCVILFFHPSLLAGAGAYLLFKAIDYSVFRAGKEILYIPLPFDARFRAKELIDAFIYRASKGVTSGLIASATLLFGRLPGAIYPSIAIVSATVWLYFIHLLTRNRK